ncbi:MAG: hypothetical protein MUC43_05485 [Pirellula sp.]|nr:hypothetical protein [Pirellula sp.]
MNRPTNASPSIVVLLAFSSISLLVGCWSSNEAPKPPSVDTKWIELWDQSLALLENKATDDKAGSKVDTAIEGFRKLIAQFPDDAAAQQNLAVGLLVQIKKFKEGGDSSRIPELEKECLAALAKLKQMQPDSTDAIVLESRIYVNRGDFTQAIKLMSEASAKPTATKDVWFQLIDLIGPDATDSELVEMRELLEKGLNQSSNSLVLNAYYLVTLAKLKDSKFSDQLEKCVELCRPLLSNEKRDLEITKLRDAIGKGNWNGVQGGAFRLRNVLVGEIEFKQDLHYLKRDDHLEYAITRSGALPVSAVGKRSTPVARFESVASPIIVSDRISAIATEDVDLDGKLDLLVSTPAGIDVWSFANPSEPKKIISTKMSVGIKGMVLVDLDRDFQRSREQIPPSPLPSAIPIEQRKKENDGFVDTDVDLIAYGQDGLLLFENAMIKETGIREFTPRPLSEGMESLKGIRQVVAIDMDHDSDLDLIVSSDSGLSIWSNRGNWTFADMSAFSNMPASDKAVSNILALDLDRNVVNDFLLGSDSASAPTMMASNLHGRYAIRDIAWPRETEGSFAFLEAIDVNQDACWDVVMGGDKGLKLVKMNSLGHTSWKPDNVTKLSDDKSAGLMVLDVDNDTFPDVVTWGPKGIALYRGGADQTLIRDEKGLAISDSISKVIPLDFDSDRDDDLIALSEKGELIWLRNQDGNKNHQLEIVLRADEDGSQAARARCNMHGVGSVLEIKTNGTYQSQIVRGTRTRFGLGAKNQADILRVIWTNGIPNNIFNVDSRVTVFDQQNLGGSCPYLYTWNGERFEFVTDCLWAAPIGLQFAAGVTAPTREWEYLKIDGELLKPKDDSYILQITEELWEAAYFDSVKLLAIDHPKEIDVFTNEKVGPAEISEFKIRTVENRIYPKSIIDQNGNDLREWTNKRDQRYTRTWTEGYNQGLTKPHWLEIDFREETPNAAQAKPSKEIVLYMTGWLFPTCTSLNLASDENPLKPKLQPPSIQVPDADGNWVEVVPYAGFPGGKTKTIAIDVTDVFLCDDHRIRLVSNMELCWDEVFYTRGERKPRSDSFVVTPLELQSADLHYRGFSELIPQPGNAPKRYEYNSVTKEHQVWRCHETHRRSGRFAGCNGSRRRNDGSLFSECNEFTPRMGSRFRHLQCWLG